MGVQARLLANFISLSRLVGSNNSSKLNISSLSTSNNSRRLNSNLSNKPSISSLSTSKGNHSSPRLHTNNLNTNRSSNISSHQVPHTSRIVQETLRSMHHLLQTLAVQAPRVINLLRQATLPTRRNHLKALLKGTHTQDNHSPLRPLGLHQTFPTSRTSARRNKAKTKGPISRHLPTMSLRLGVLKTTKVPVVKVTWTEVYLCLVASRRMT